MTLTSLFAFVSGAILARRKEPEPEPESFVCERCGIKSYNPHDIRERYCGRCHEFDAMARARADLKEQIERLKAEKTTLLQHLTERDLRIDATRRFDPGHFGFCTCVPGRFAMFRRQFGMVDSIIDALDGE
jgi:ribosomal protein L37E